MHKILAYGTLRKDERNHKYLEGAEFLGEFFVYGFSMHNLGDFPACIESFPEKRILAEMYEISDETLKNIDRLEGFPNFYDRITVRVGENDTWIYVLYYATEYPEITSGDWKKRSTANAI